MTDSGIGLTRLGDDHGNASRFLPQALFGYAGFFAEMVAVVAEKNNECIVGVG
jgi:hypothetical protein